VNRRRFADYSSHLLSKHLLVPKEGLHSGADVEEQLGAKTQRRPPLMRNVGERLPPGDGVDHRCGINRPITGVLGE
jgi:hypothetical protein